MFTRQRCKRKPGSRDGELDEGFRTRVEAASQAGEVLRYVAEMEGDQLKVAL